MSASGPTYEQFYGIYPPLHPELGLACHDTVSGMEAREILGLYGIA
jgi:hypothetical protein